MRTASRAAKRNALDRFILCMGVAYLLFLIWAILWKCGTPFIGDGAERTINLSPFNHNTTWEMQFNIAVFMPFGFYLAAYNSKLTFIKFIELIMVTLFVSFALEVIQFILAIGRSDITDLLMNTLGGIVGVVVLCVLLQLFGKNARKAKLVVCILLTLLELYMTVSFITSGQLNLGFMMIRL